MLIPHLFRAIAFSCRDFNAAAENAENAADALLDGWFAASAVQRAEWCAGSALAKYHLRDFVARTADVIYFNVVVPSAIPGIYSFESHFKPVEYRAAESGQLRILRWLYRRDNIWIVDVCCIAVRNGHLACLQYAHEHGCPWNKNTCMYAARNGHLACLAYAHEHGCMWDKDTCKYAELYGHLTCLAYARERGCPSH